MRNNFPFVSVVVPVFNGAAIIGDCIESLLAQDYPKDRYEILVVDNRSTDDTASIVAKYPVTLLKEERVQSSYAARNTGVRQARGEIIAFTDADCVASPQWLKYLVAGWRNPQVCMFVGNTQAYQQECLLESYAAYVGLFQEAKFPSTNNVAYKKEVFFRVGLFDETMVSGGDIDFAIRVQREYPVSLKRVPGAMVYHKHRASLRALGKQFYRYGYGTAAVADRYRVIADAHSAFSNAYWIAAHLLAFIWHILSQVFVSRDRLSFWLPALSAYTRFFQLVGHWGWLCQHKILRQRGPAHWFVPR